MDPAGTRRRNLVVHWLSDPHTSSHVDPRSRDSRDRDVDRSLNRGERPGVGDRFAGITDDEADLLEKSLEEFDEENEGVIDGRTSVRDVTEVKDEADFHTTGPLSGAGQAPCDFVDKFLGG